MNTRADDNRESPSYILLEILTQREVDFGYFDPFVPDIRPTREHPERAGTKSVSWDSPTDGDCDCVVIATNHKDVNYAELVAWAPCIVDSRDAMAGIATKLWQVWLAKAASRPSQATSPKPKAGSKEREPDE